MTDIPLTNVEAPAPIAPAPTRGERISLRILQFGAMAVVVAASNLKVFELDRFFIPKELVLHATAVLAALFAMRAISRVVFAREDVYLILYLALSAASALLATNRWIALRAVAISASSALLFWTARGLRTAGLSRRMLRALALAVALVAVTSLLQAYGLETDLFSESRAPGGTLGNRNFVAHAGAFGLPFLLLAAIAAPTATRLLASSAGIAIVTATLVLTRSRAAWLAFVVVSFVFLVGLVASRPLRGSWRTWRRVLLILVMVGCGAAAAVAIPNALRWRSRNPYQESLERIADYREGSGHGRLVQYEQSLWMSAHHPLFGVGPGNWAVVYPAHAVRNDPSMTDSDPGMTFNPWPSSDWIASISERGIIATAFLAIFFLSMAARALRQLHAAVDFEEALRGVVLIAALAGALIAGLFDAVLLLALPALLIWTALGALVDPPPPADHRAWKGLVLALVVICSAAGAARSVMQLTAMQIYATRGDRASLERAAQIDPGNYRLQLRLARGGARKTRCAHAKAAHALYPHARAAAALARGCP